MSSYTAVSQYPDPGGRSSPSGTGCSVLYSQYMAAQQCLSVCIRKEKIMLHYAIVFLVIALIAAVFGFGGIAASAVGIAKILFFVFLVMAVITFLMGLVKK